MAEKRTQIRLEAGLEWIEQWSSSAGQAEQNALYKALFAISDGSVFWTHLTLGDARRAEEFFVVVREDLVVKIHFHNVDAFSIVYIGVPRDAPGYGLGIDWVG